MKHVNVSPENGKRNATYHHILMARLQCLIRGRRNPCLNEAQLAYLHTKRILERLPLRMIQLSEGGSSLKLLLEFGNFSFNVAVSGPKDEYVCTVNNFLNK